MKLEVTVVFLFDTEELDNEEVQQVYLDLSDIAANEMRLGILDSDLNGRDVKGTFLNHATISVEEYQ